MTRAADVSGMINDRCSFAIIDVNRASRMTYEHQLPIVVLKPTLSDGHHRHEFEAPSKSSYLRGGGRNVAVLM
ncbi:hypothetical protein V3C99_011312 [Haemonchus contortus]